MSGRAKRTPVPAEVVDVEAAVRRLAYVLTRTKRHEWMKATSRVPLDRAAMAVLRELDESGAMRLGELAAVLHVEAPHITRQVQLLERKGYARRRPDPDDKRAQRIELTVAGKAAAERVRAVSQRGIQDALSHWAPEQLRELGTLLLGMVDDFSAHAAENDSDTAAETVPA